MQSAGWSIRAAKAAVALVGPVLPLSACAAGSPLDPAIHASNQSTALPEGVSPMESSPIVSDARSESPLELASIVAALLSQLTQPDTVPSPSEFLIRIGTSTDASRGEFPSTVEHVIRRCGHPAHDLQRYAEQFVCGEESGQYEEVTAAAYGWWSSISDLRSADAQRYAARSNEFTIGSLREALLRAGFEDYGLIESQSSVHGFPTPLVHSAFRRSGLSPIVIAGHRPDQVKSSQSVALPPAIMELRLYFPVQGMK
jgi:hypothetical protein